jgi:hypothetical protein
MRRKRQVRGRGRDWGLVHGAVDAFVLDDLNVAPFAGLLQTEEHGPLSKGHHGIRFITRYQAYKMGQRGTTFCENAEPVSTISIPYERGSRFTVQVGPRNNTPAATSGMPRPQSSSYSSGLAGPRARRDARGQKRVDRFPGMRESAQSWKELLVDLKARGLTKCSRQRVINGVGCTRR